MKKTVNIARPAYLNLWWFPILVGAIVLLGLTTVLIPQSTKIIESARNLKQLNQDLEKAEQKISQIDQVDVEEIGELDNLFSKALPQQKPYFEVMLLLQQLASQTGVALGDFELNPGQLGSDSAKVDRQESADGYVTLDTKLNLNGTSEQMSNFMVMLHSSMPLLVVDEISISNNVKKDDSSQRSSQIALKILYMKQTKHITDVDLEPLKALSGDAADIKRTLSGYLDPTATIIPGTSIIQNSSRTNIFDF